MNTNKLGWPILVALCWTVLLYLMLPTLVAIPVSVTPERYLSLPKGEISFVHYRTLLTDPTWIKATMQSLMIAAIATGFSLVIGTAAAIGLWRLSSQSAETVRLLIMAPMIVPSVVSALAFYWFFSRLGLIDTFFGLILAHTVLAIPYVIIAVAASLATINSRQEQASRSLGASSSQTIRMVILPQIIPGVLTGAVFAFLTSWDEIVVTLFVASRTVYTLPRRLWDGIQERVDPTIAAAATVLLLLTVLLILVRSIQDRLREQRAGD